MSFLNVGVCVMVLALMGCNRFVADGQPLAGIAPFGEKTDAATDYLEVANLNIAQTGDLAKNVKSNAVTIKGTGTKSTYTIQYKFTTSALTSFKVMQTYTDKASEECDSSSEPERKLVLKGGKEPIELNLVQQYQLESNKEYILEVSHSNPSCKKINLTFDILAWLGTATVSPSLAIVCQSSQVGTVTFLPGWYTGMAFSTATGKEKFLSSNVYCGEAFEGELGPCSSERAAGKPDFSKQSAILKCESKKGDQKRSYSAKIDLETQTATVACQTNDKETFSEQMQSCERQVIDPQPYKDILAPKK